MPQTTSELPFDPQAFLEASIEEAFSTSMEAVPEGTYSAVISKIDQPRVINTKNGDKLVIDLHWEILDSNGTLEEITGRDKNVVRQTLWLDTSPEGHLLAGKGKNVDLGRLREALGQNTPGRPWSWNMMLGIPCTIQVEHSMNGDKIYANVTKVLGSEVPF